MNFKDSNRLGLASTLLFLPIEDTEYHECPHDTHEDRAYGETGNGNHIDIVVETAAFCHNLPLF